jgi:centromere protein I
LAGHRYARWYLLTLYRMALARQTGDPSILGLLRVYKNYYPEIIVGAVTKGRASAFKHPDPAWREHLDQLQAAHARREHVRQTSQHNGFRVQSSFGGRRARQNGVVPIVHSAHATESSITLEEVDNAEQFAANLESFELPSQMAAVLADPLLQKLILLRPQHEAQERLARWLSGCLQDIASGETDEKHLSDILEAISTYVEGMKVWAI